MIIFQGPEGSTTEPGNGMDPTPTGVKELQGRENIVAGEQRQTRARGPLKGRSLREAAK